MLQITETLQAKNERFKQKTNAANKKRTLQTNINERCKQKMNAANKKEHFMRAHAAKRTGQSPELCYRVAMFCSGCGLQLLTAAKFCHDCGLTTGVKDDDSLCVAELEMESSERKRHQSTPLTFDEYREKKGKERSSRFVSKKSVKKVKKENNESEVTIHIGLIRLKDEELKVIRGSTLPLKVLPSIGAEELLRKRAEKIVKFNSDLSLYGVTSCALLYPDRTEVKCLPGGTEPFTLQRYKEELGKSYNRITLYLCKKTAILDALFLKSYNSDESDADLPAYEEV